MCVRRIRLRDQQALLPGRHPVLLRTRYIRGSGRPAVPEQRRRHVYGRLRGGGHRQSGRQGPRGGGRRLRWRRMDGYLRGQRPDAGFPVPEQWRRHVYRHGFAGGRGLWRGRRRPGGHGGGYRRLRPERVAGYLRDQFLPGTQLAAPEQRERHLHRNHFRRGRGQSHASVPGIRYGLQGFRSRWLAGYLRGKRPRDRQYLPVRSDDNLRADQPAVPERGERGLFRRQP